MHTYLPLTTKAFQRSFCMREQNSWHALHHATCHARDAQNDRAPTFPPLWKCEISTNNLKPALHSAFHTLDHNHARETNFAPASKAQLAAERRENTGRRALPRWHDAAIAPSALLYVAALERAADVVAPNAAPPQHVFLRYELVLGVLAAARPPPGCIRRGRHRIRHIGRHRYFCCLIILHSL